MKFVYVSLFLSLHSFNLFGQSEDCKFVNLFTNEAYKLAFTEYFDYAKRTSSFPVLGDNGPMGIYLITQSTNKDGDAIWIIETCLDDRFKEFCCWNYSFYNGHLFLVAKADAITINGSALDTKFVQDYSQRKKQMKCIEQIVGDRVYIRPNHAKRMIYGSRSEKGIMEWYESKVDITGNRNKRCVITFKKDNTYTITSGA